MGCAACISLSNMIGSNLNSMNEKAPTVEGWVPVLFAVFTPLLFTSSGLLSKHMCLKRGFEPFKQLYFAYFCAGLFLFSILLTRLDQPNFSPRLLLIGTLGSIINIIGLSMINKAITLGPIGAVSALT